MLLEIALAAALAQSQPAETAPAPTADSSNVSNVTPAPQEPADCAKLSHDLIPQMSKWEYKVFNGAGWRTLANHECYFEAGTSIVSWMSEHQKTMTKGEEMSLRYQAARVFAMAGRSDLATLHLAKAHNPDQGPNPAMNWNAYVDAFAAYLDRNQLHLMDALKALEAQPADKEGGKPNLVAARRFLVCFNKPYAMIETTDDCLAGAEALSQDQDKAKPAETPQAAPETAPSESPEQF